MRTRKLCLATLTLGMAGLLPAGVARQDGDWQIWAAQSVDGALDEAWTVYAKQEEKWDDDELFEYNVDFGFKHRPASQWELGLLYRQQYVKSGNDWLEENRPWGYGTYKWNWGELSLADRNRVEVRFRDGRDTILRYRNKLTATGPWKFTAWSLKPYLADEVFIDSDQGDLNKNRFYVGLKAKPATHFKSELFGIWQIEEKGSHWIDIYAIGLKAGFTF